MASESLTLARTSPQSRGPFLAGLYVAFGLADLVMSLGAFALGTPEGNPVLAVLLRHGLFIPAKLALTGLAALLIAALYHRPVVRGIAWGALALMAAVDLWHVVSLTALVNRH